MKQEHNVTLVSDNVTLVSDNVTLVSDMSATPLWRASGTIILHG
jgi:hypothetical protein